MAKKRTTPRKLYTKVHGVTYGNRQKLIRRHCRDGDRLDLRPEPWNRHSDHAVGVWVRKRGWILRGWRKLGYIPDDDAEDIAELLDDGWTANARIWKVVGGYDGLNVGLRIDVFLIPPRQPEPPPRPVASTPPAARGPLIPEPVKRALAALARGALRIARPIAPVVIPPIAAAWLLFRLAGRGRDVLGILLVAALLAAGFYSIRYVLSLKPDNLADDFIEVEMPEIESQLGDRS